MSNSLLSLIKAAYGGVRMTDHLEEISESLLNGFISNFWKSVAPPDTEKRLGSWMALFSCRLEQSLAWIQEGTLTVVWIGGFMSCQSHQANWFIEKGFALLCTPLVQEVTCQDGAWYSKVVTTRRH